MGRNRKLVEFSPDLMKHHRLGKEIKYGVLYKPLRSMSHLFKRLIGDFSREDKLRLACDCEPPMYFMLRGLIIAHPYGITLSADEIGADCRIAQNVTIGTSGRTMNPGEGTKDKPKLGNLVSCYPHAVISGSVSIGNNVIIAARAFVDKDVPDNSIAYDCNIVRPLKEHHKNYLQQQLWHCINVYHLVPGLGYASGKLYIDEEYARSRTEMLRK